MAKSVIPQEKGAKRSSLLTEGAEKMKKSSKKKKKNAGMETSNKMDFVSDNHSNGTNYKMESHKRKSDSAETSPSKKKKLHPMKFNKGNMKKENETVGLAKVKTIKGELDGPRTKEITEKKNNNERKFKPSFHKPTSEEKFKVRKRMRKQNKKGADIIQTLKTDWDDLRREDCTPEKKSQLLKKMCGVLKGRAKEFAFAHDTVRVLECVFAEGTEEHRSFLFEELKDEIINLSKSIYGKFFVLKILRYGSKKQKEAVINLFQGIVTKLMNHTHAAEVVETAYNECANASQRFQLVQEFYGAQYRHFKESDIQTLPELLAKKPESKELVISSMKEELLKCLKKNVVKHSLIHHVLLQFFHSCDDSSRSDIIQSLREVVSEILHTKDGSRVAMYCVWHGNHKDRKVIIKHMKTFVKKIAMEEHGHMVLLALFDCVDDIRLMDNIIIKELQDSMLQISENVHGKKVLIYLLNPRDPHFFHPDVINILKSGDNNEFSKKEPEVRHRELNAAIAGPLAQLIIDNIADLYKNNAFCLFTAIILKHIVGDRRKAFESIAKLAAEPYSSENKNVHILEQSGSYFMLKQLILNDTSGPVKKEDLDSITFSEVLVNTVPDGVMSTWCSCNRGAFLLLNLLETKIPPVVKRVADQLMGFHKHLDKLIFKGAELLVKKLRKLTVD